jgi:5'-3' exonuclease
LLSYQKNISDFAGKRLAIDASGWLHRALFAVAEDWVDSNCKDNQLYVDHVVSHAKFLLSRNVTPVLVFDGRRNILKVFFISFFFL